MQLAILAELASVSSVMLFLDIFSDNEQDNASQITVLRGTEAALNPSMTNHFC